jgi:hypothetical protein
MSAWRTGRMLLLVLGLAGCSDPPPDPPAVPPTRIQQQPAVVRSVPPMDEWTAFLARCGTGPLPDACTGELRALAPSHRDEFTAWARGSACASLADGRCRLARSVLAAQGDLAAAAVLTELETDPAHALLQTFDSAVLLALWGQDCGHDVNAAVLCPWLAGLLAVRGDLRPLEQTQAQKVRAALALLDSTEPAERADGRRRWQALQDPPAVFGMLRTLADGEIPGSRRETLTALLRKHAQDWTPQLREALKAGSMPVALTAARLTWRSDATELSLQEWRQAQEAREARQRAAALLPQLRALEGRAVIITLVNDTVRKGTLLGIHGNVVNLARTVSLMGQSNRVTSSVAIAEIRELRAAPE